MAVTCQCMSSYPGRFETCICTRSGAASSSVDSYCVLPSSRLASLTSQALREQHWLKATGASGKGKAEQEDPSVSALGASPSLSILLQILWHRASQGFPWYFLIQCHSLLISELCWHALNSYGATTWIILWPCRPSSSHALHSIRFPRFPWPLKRLVGTTGCLMQIRPVSGIDCPSRAVSGIDCPFRAVSGTDCRATSGADC